MSKKECKPSQKKSGDFTKDPLSDKIGNSLRELYDDVVNEPIPDDFLKLLEKAEAKKPSS